MQLSARLRGDGGDVLADAVAENSAEMLVDAEKREVMLHLLGAVDVAIHVRLALGFDVAETTARWRTEK